jgi:16S rRNA (cytidine1402-2'-O)-methyltransferase
VAGGAGRAAASGAVAASAGGATGGTGTVGAPDAGAGARAASAAGALGAAAGATGGAACGVGVGARADGAGAIAGAVAHADNASAAAIDMPRANVRKAAPGTRGRSARETDNDVLAAAITNGESMSDEVDRGRRWLEASGVATQDWPAGALYVVATPIGNAGDLSLRALWLLSMADAVFAEDTRVTRTLLERFGIRPHALVAAHQHNEEAAGAAIVARLAAGERVALVTDAGTPAISDPGARIVRAVRGAGRRVIPLPGASSLLAALAASDMAEHGFSFLGFLPTATRERERTLRAAAARGDAFALFEAPHRIEATLHALAQLLDPTREVAVARELTKKFESIDVVPARDLVCWLAQQTQRGEYVLVVGPANAAPAGEEIDATTRRWLDALADALPASKAAAAAAKATGLPRAALYAALTQLRGATDD